MSEQGSTAEGEGFISRRIVKKTKCQAFSDFMYNKEDGSVMGRTCKSWLLIGAFYLALYAFLALFFVICMLVFVATLSDDHPTYYGKGSILGSNPGLGYMPWLKNDTESTLIAFNQNDVGSYRKYVTTMDKYLQDNYDKHIEDFKDCANKGDAPKDTKGKPCKFDRNDTMFKDCTKDDYGFKTGTPCIALQLNRLIDWEPVDYPDGSVPDPVKKRYKPGDIAVDCAGEHAADKDNMGPVEYYPKSGFPGKYFPYRRYTKDSKKLYHSPLVFVQFHGLPTDHLIMVECRAYAYNIIHESQQQLGMVHIEFLREKPKSG